MKKTNVVALAVAGIVAMSVFSQSAKAEDALSAFEAKSITKVVRDINQVPGTWVCVAQSGNSAEALKRAGYGSIIGLRNLEPEIRVDPRRRFKTTEQFEGSVDYIPMRTIEETAVDMQFSGKEYREGKLPAGVDVYAEATPLRSAVFAMREGETLHVRINRYHHIVARIKCGNLTKGIIKAKISLDLGINTPKSKTVTRVQTRVIERERVVPNVNVTPTVTVGDVNVTVKTVGGSGFSGYGGSAFVGGMRQSESVTGSWTPRSGGIRINNSSYSTSSSSSFASAVAQAIANAQATANAHVTVPPVTPPVTPPSGGGGGDNGPNPPGVPGAGNGDVTDGRDIEGGNRDHSNAQDDVSQGG